MQSDFGELKTLVNEAAINWYLNSENMKVSWARFHSHSKNQQQTLEFEIAAHTQDKTYLGKSLLGLCELAFEYLSFLASNPIDLENVNRVWDENHPDPFEVNLGDGLLPIWNSDAYFERQFFSDDEDHRYMWHQMGENFQTPDQVVFTFTFFTFDPSFGRDLESGKLRVVESLKNWRLVEKGLVQPDKFFERIVGQPI
jgi:hypothetical protein